MKPRLALLLLLLLAAHMFPAFAYDALGRQFATLPPATVGGGPRHGITNQFDALGRKVQTADQAGRTTGFRYDALSRLTQVTNALGKLTAYGYDATGNQTNQTDALARATAHTHDLLGRRVERRLPGNVWEGWAYDLLGRTQHRTNFDGVVITHEHDRLGRLTRRRQGAAVLEESQYSALGQLTNRVDAAGTHVWRYDVHGRLRTNTTPAGALYYGYDAAGRLTALGTGTAGGVTNQYQYDALGRLTNVVDLRLATTAKNTGYGYDGAGNLAWLKYNPNGVTNHYRYDSQNRLTNLAWKLGSTDRAGFHYTLGLAGNRLTLLETNNGVVRSYTWGYDNAYRLLSEQITGAAPTGTLGYTYDDVGNRLTRSAALGLTNQTVSFDLRDQLDNDTTPATASTFFDVRGNTTGYFGAWQYDWAGRLTNYNSGAAAYVYDADGNRTKKIAGGTTTHYLVATVNPTGWPQVVEEHTGTSPGTLSRRYTYGLDLVSQWQSVGSATHFYLTDGLGSVRALLNASGAVSDTYTYDAWGGLINSTGTTPNSYRFAGEQWDADLGLYYNRARYLNPNLGRFQTRDTFEGHQTDPLSLHAYLYCGGDPVNNIDPTGLFDSAQAMKVTLVIGAIVTGAVFTAPPLSHWDTTRQLKRIPVAEVQAELARQQPIIELLELMVEKHGQPTFNELGLKAGGRMTISMKDDSPGQEVRNIWEQGRNIAGWSSAGRELLHRILSHGSLEQLVSDDQLAPHQRAYVCEALIERQKAYKNWLQAYLKGIAQE
jgi:RHS repeat-associated protein